jgi:hypothetical protein
MSADAMGESSSSARRRDTPDRETNATSKPKRPRTILYMAALYLVIACTLLWVTVNNSADEDLSNLTRVLLGSAGIVLCVSAVFTVMRFEWARKLCIGIHAAALGVMLIVLVRRGIDAPSFNVGLVFQGLIPVAVQLAFIGFWMGQRVVEWFAWRPGAPLVHDASSSSR